MTRWGGPVVGRISLVVVIVAALGVLASPGVEAQVPPASTEVTVPPVTLPPVTIPPVTVPPVLADPLPPSIGDVLDGTTGAVDEVVGQVGGLLPGGATAPPVTTPPLPPSTTPSTDPVSGSRPGPGPGGSGAGTVGGAGGAPSDAFAVTAEDDSGSAGARAPRRVLRRLAASGASLNAVDLPLAPADPLDDAVQRDARHFGWPVVLGLLIAAFLAFQHRADRHERKLADAPLDQGERLRFK